jgi:hypothetical protein
MTGEGAEDVTYGDELSRDQEAGSEKDDDLVTRAKSDPEAFGQLYDRYFDPIYRYCSWRLHTQVAAEDATSQIFLKALAGLPGYRPNTSSSTRTARTGPWRNSTWRSPSPTAIRGRKRAPCTQRRSERFGASLRTSPTNRPISYGCGWRG